MDSFVTSGKSAISGLFMFADFYVVNIADFLSSNSAVDFLNQVLNNLGGWIY